MRRGGVTLSHSVVLDPPGSQVGVHGGLPGPGLQPAELWLPDCAGRCSSIVSAPTKEMTCR